MKANEPRRQSWLGRIGPGVLVAATGVGAADLVVAGMAGAALGWSVIFAVAFGAAMKLFLNEGIARWQLGTRTTVLEVWVNRLHLGWLLLPYLVIWGLAVATVLVKVVGVAGHSLFPLHDTPKTSALIWGGLHSVAGILLISVGGYKLFERFMAAFVALMFVTVIFCAARLAPEMRFPPPDWAQIGAPSSIRLLIGLIGGVGGTLTILSYGYWIQEAGRVGEAGLRESRFDLRLGYGMTALFGVAMVLIASTIPGLESARVGFAERVAARIESEIGLGAKWLFLVGFWGAVFSSLLGVWQGVPYLFADVVHNLFPAHSTGPRNISQSFAYRSFAGFLAVPAIFLAVLDLKLIVLAYSLLGAIFMFPLAISLLVMNNRRDWISAPFRNRTPTNVVLAMTALFFVVYGVLEIRSRMI